MSAFTNPNVAQRHTQVNEAGKSTADGDILGLTATSKVGFFGTMPVAQQVVPATSPTLAQLITALVNSGLIAQHD